MKVHTFHPIQFNTGDILDPAELNALNLYAADVLDDVGSRRFQRSCLVLPFVESVATPYTQAHSSEARTYRFRCDQTCVIERAFLNAQMTSAGEVRVTIATSTGGTTPTGATTPWLSSGGAVASATTTITDENGSMVLLTAGTEYSILVASTGNFTLERFDVVLHLATDRWVPSTLDTRPRFAPVLFTDASAPDATVVNANSAALTTAAGSLASTKTAAAPMLFVAHGIIGTGGSATDVDLRTFTVPRFDASRAQATAIRLFVFAVFDAPVTATCTATLLAEDGVTVLATASAALAATSQKTGTAGTISVSLTSVTPNVTSTGASDYSLVLGTNTATACRKLYALLWISR